MRTNRALSNRFQFTILIACAAIFCFVAQAQAASIEYRFALTSSQQVPTNASTAMGNCLVTLDDESGLVNVSCQFSGLSSAATAAHVHGLAGPGINAGVVLGLTATAATSGTIAGNGVLDASQMAGMMSGQTYVNLHSGQNPGGEIRGQVKGGLSAIPTLTNSFLMTLVVLLLAVGFVAFRRRAL
jgi:hypothetical protein